MQKIDLGQTIGILANIGVIAEIEADMAAQLVRVREMERNGELEPIPEVSATTQ